MNCQQGSTVNQALESLRATRARTLNLLTLLTQEQVDFKPKHDKWSIGEIADHIRRAEEFNRHDIMRLIELQKAGQRPVVRQTLDVVNISVFSIPKPIFALFETPLNFFGRFLPTGARDVLTLSRLVKLQNPDNVTPTPRRSRSELEAELKTSFQTTERIFSDHSQLNFQKMIFVQPLLGSMNVVELVQWMALHEQRHQKQICEVLISDGFPTVAAAI